MYSTFDTQKQLLMIGFTAERYNQLTKILATYTQLDSALKNEAEEILAFFEASKLAIVFNQALTL